VNLTCFLFKSSVHSFDVVLRDKYLSGQAAFEQVSASVDLPFPYRALLQRNRPKPPRWLDYLAESFDLSGAVLTNVSNSFILLVEARGRVFAFTFGYAHNALDQSHMEPDFGLRTALNMLSKDGIKTVDARNVDVVTHQRRLNSSVASRIEEFDLDYDTDWIRYVAGNPKSEKIATRVSGASSLRVNTDRSVKELGSFCEVLLDTYESEAYKESFGFVDYVRPLPSTDQRLEILNRQLREFVSNRERKRISLAFPEMPDWERLDRIKVFRGYSNIFLEELTLDSIYAFLDNNPGISAEEASIIGLDDNAQPVTKKRPLMDYLVCELEHDGQRYVCTSGKWFSVDADYLRRINEQLASIDDLTHELALPPKHAGETEKAYNARVAQQKGWVLLDRDLFHPPVPYQKVEICDLLAPEGHFINVKRMVSSATLSHLFSQGSVSATLLKEYEVYRATVQDLARNKWSDWQLPSSVAIVYAIPTNKDDDLSDELFFFSKINLVNNARVVRRLGYSVGLCKVEIEDS